MRHVIAASVFALLAAAPDVAHATWSVVGVDAATGEVGVAVASCVEAPFGTTLLPDVVGLAPGVGALAAQALLNAQTRDLAVMLLTQGVAPDDIITMVNATDPGSALRQYGVVTLDGQIAGFTGSSTMAWAGHLQGDGVSVQGNILLEPAVADDALAAFEAPAPRCPWTLADRLMDGLEAGSVRGGDQRCSAEQSALAAVIMVARPDDDAESPTLNLRVPSQPMGGDNPVVLLREEYTQWRQQNPPDDAGCVGGTTGDETGPAPPADGTTGPDAASSGQASDGPPPPADPTTTGASPPPADSGGATSGAASSDASSGACACDDRAGPPPSWAWVVLLLAARRRRDATPPNAALR